MGFQEQHYDVAVLGGGLSGFAVARTCAKAGLKTLLVERRPVLGWESTWAFQLDFRGGRSDCSTTLARAMFAAGGLRDQRLDAPILEIVLDQQARDNNIEVLYYSQAVGLSADEEGVAGILLASKAGEKNLSATAFVDATENALLWRLTGAPVEASPGVARFAVFANGVQQLELPRELGTVTGLAGVTLKPGVWPGEVAIEFDIPSCDIRMARRALPGLLSELREAVPEFATALISHVAVEPVSLDLCFVSGLNGFQHPAIPNLFGARTWSAPEGTEQGTVAGRLDLGEEVGEELVRILPDLARRSVTQPSRQSLSAPPLHSCEVLVCGGGTAGALAAIAAGRKGTQTTLLEASTFLGGIGSGGGIHIYYHGVTGGLQDEVDDRVREMTPLFGPAGTVQGFHPEVKKVVLQQMAEEAGVDLVFNTTVTGVEMEDLPSDLPATGTERAARRTAGVVAAGPEGNASYRAKVVIDSSGDGDVAFMAGAPFTFGRDTDNLPHAYSQAAGRLDAEGKLLVINFDAGYCDPSDVEDLTRARRHGLAHYRRERYAIENRLVYVAPLLGLRNSRQIVGDYRLTLADEIASREFPDVVAYARSHYDNHAPDYENESDEAMLWVWLLGNWHKPIGCEIPYRCLLPQGVEGLLIACRAISLSHDAHNQCRMQRDMQRLGEAAGMAAALCAKKDLLPRQLDVEQLQAALLDTGALGPRERHKLTTDVVRSESAIRNLQSEIHNPAFLPPAPPVVPEQQLISDLGGEDPRQAVWGLCRAGEGSLPLLLEAANSGNRDQRFWASVTLAMLHRAEAVPALLECVKQRREDKPERLRAAPTWYGALALLGRLGDSRALTVIAEMLEDPNVGLHPIVAGVRSLGRIGDPAAVQVIDGLLSRTDLLCSQPLQLSVGPVEPVQEDARWQLDLAAAEALARLGSPRPQLVASYLEDSRAYVRRYARKVQQGNQA